MKSAFFTTAVMMVLALVTTGLAIYYYPWPEPEVQNEVEQLFDPYEGSQVRGLEIVQFNRDRGALERIFLVRRGDRWVIPDKENFVATQGTRIALAINSLSALKVIDFISDNQQDHLDYGVVDPEDWQQVSNRSALGTKITLTDRNKKVIASLIVGLPVKNDNQQQQRFARVAGQPSIYVVNYDANVLSTNLAAWISTNPLQLATTQNDSGNQLDGLIIDNYRLEGPSLDELKRKTLYRAEIRPVGNRLDVVSLKAGQVGSDELREIVPTPEHIAQLTSTTRFLGAIVTNDVKRKDPRAAAVIRGDQEFSAEAVAPMKDFGFVNARVENGNFLCDSVSGQIHVTTPTGVVLTISIGQIAGTVQDGSGRLNYYVIYTATVDYDKLKLPEKPADLNEDTESPEYRAYMRSVEEARQQQETARQIADGLNSLHADWYYLIDEQVIRSIRPDIDIPVQASAPAGGAPGGNATSEADDSGSEE